MQEDNQNHEKEEKLTARDYFEAGKPTPAFVGVSWISLLLGISAYMIGLWNATITFNEKGYYFTVLLFGLFSSVSLQKTIRDRMEGVKTTNIYYSICWISLLISIVLITVGLYNADMLLSEKGFYAMAYVLSLFSSVAVQKNVRDLAQEE